MEVGESKLQNYKYDIQTDLEDLSLLKDVDKFQDKMREIDKVYEMARNWKNLERHLEQKKNAWREELDNCFDETSVGAMAELDSVMDIMRMMGGLKD